MCEHCTYEKQKRISFSTQRVDNKIRPLELVSLGVHGSMDVTLLGGSTYFVIFQYDCTRRMDAARLPPKWGYKTCVIDFFKNIRKIKAATNFAYHNQRFVIFDKFRVIDFSCYFRTNLATTLEGFGFLS